MTAPTTPRRAVNPALATGFSRALAEAIFQHLTELDSLAAQPLRMQADQVRVRRAMAELIGCWRAQLDKHLADRTGRCPRCRTWWGGRMRWPCGVWQQAHTSLLT
jgi:hypothetical protein